MDDDDDDDRCGWCGDEIEGQAHDECATALLGMADILELGAIEGEMLIAEAHASATRARAAAFPLLARSIDN